MQFALSTWWDIAFKVTFNLIVVEACSLETHMAYLWLLNFFLNSLCWYVDVEFEMF
jgi:hypothetical protein